MRITGCCSSASGQFLSLLNGSPPVLALPAGKIGTINIPEASFYVAQYALPNIFFCVLIFLFRDAPGILRDPFGLYPLRKKFFAQVTWAASPKKARSASGHRFVVTCSSERYGRKRKDIPSGLPSKQSPSNRFATSCPCSRLCCTDAHIAPHSRADDSVSRPQLKMKFRICNHRVTRMNASERNLWPFASLSSSKHIPRRIIELAKITVNGVSSRCSHRHWEKLATLT